MPLGKGAKKALASMRKTYGKSRGTRVFYATKNKYGKRKTETSFYKKGGKQRPKRRK